MRPLPRFAVGTIQPDARREPVLWGLLAALHELDITPALFRSSCRLTDGDAAQAVTGCAARHLDSWAMSRFGAKQTLVRSVAASELAIVEGEFGATSRRPGGLGGSPTASNLDTLCDWLELPRLAIVDVRKLSLCNLPLGNSPQGIMPVDGLLLDRVADDRERAYWQTQLETLHGAPVLGYLDEATQLRALCASLPACGNPSPDLCAALGRRLVRSLDVERLLGLACRTPPIAAEPEPYVLTPSSPHKFRIALAYDDAFCGYYPESLDLLEAAGAELCDFSPLKSEALPKDADIVYVGCGHPERFAEELAANHCLKQSLRSFAAGGGRVYGQGAGLVYLCRDLVFPSGKVAPMTGLLPASAHWLDGAQATDASPFEPAEVEFGSSSWMMPAHTRLRGYRHTSWQLEPRGPLLNYARDARQQLDIVGRGNVIGSRVLINLAANRHLLARFFHPYKPALSAAGG